MLDWIRIGSAQSLSSNKIQAFDRQADSVQQLPHQRWKSSGVWPTANEYLLGLRELQGITLSTLHFFIEVVFISIFLSLSFIISDCLKVIETLSSFCYLRNKLTQTALVVQYISHSTNNKD